MSLSELADFFIFISICCILFHCVKSIQIRSFFWSFFSCIRTECGQEKTSYLDTFHAVFDFTLSDMNTCFRRWLINGDLNYVFQFRRKLGRPKMSRKNILCLFISLPQQLLQFPDAFSITDVPNFSKENILWKCDNFLIWAKKILIKTKMITSNRYAYISLPK